MNKSSGFTPEDKEKLKEYIAEIKRLDAEEPQKAYDLMTEEELAQVDAYLLHGVGDKPPQADLFTVTEITDPKTGEVTKAYYDTAWEAWNNKCIAINEKYHDSIFKVIQAAMQSKIPDNTAVMDLIDEIISTAIEQSKTFSSIRQGSATNALSRINSLKKNTVIDRITGAATVKAGSMTVSFPHFSSIEGMKPTTHRLLDAITVAFTESGAKDRVVNIALSDYMDRCKLKDRKEARKQVKADLETLFDARITFKEKSTNGSGGGFVDVRICEAKGLSRSGIITFKFSDTYYHILKRCCIMPYPEQMFTLDNHRFPHAPALLRKIAEHKNMNIGKANEDIIRVRTLLESAPAIPTFDEVNKSDRHYSERIIRPFEKNMDALEETLTWEYCHSKGAPLTDEELENFSYQLFKTLMVKVTWKNYPDQTARLERRAACLEKATTSKKKKA